MKLTEKIVNDIIIEACKYHEVDFHDTRKKTRKREIVETRQLIYWLLIKFKNMKIINTSLNEIGKIFNQDHATAYHAFKNISGFLDLNYPIKDFAMEFEHNVYSNILKKVKPTGAFYKERITTKELVVQTLFGLSLINESLRRERIENNVIVYERLKEWNLNN